MTTRAPFSLNLELKRKIKSYHSENNQSLNYPRGLQGQQVYVHRHQPEVNICVKHMFHETFENKKNKKITTSKLNKSHNKKTTKNT